MIRLEFGELAVNMLDAAALDAALLGDFASGFDLSEVESTTGELNYDVAGGANSARVRMLGVFTEDNPGGPTNFVSQLFAYSHADALGGFGSHRLILTATPDMLFDTIMDEFLVGGDLAALFAAESVEIRGSRGFGDTLEGGSLGDLLFGYGGRDRLFGHEGGDRLTGNGGNDRLFGGDGNDRLLGSSGNDFLAGGSGDDVLRGAGGADRLDGGAGVDALSGMGGNDRLAWSQEDSHNGGGGNLDVLAVAGAGASITLNALPAGTIRNVEIIDLTGTGDNVLNVTVQEVLDISSSSNTLRVMCDVGDNVQRGDGWTEAGQVTIGGEDYFRYRAVTASGTATLLVDTDVGSVGT